MHLCANRHEEITPRTLICGFFPETWRDKGIFAQVYCSRPGPNRIVIQTSAKWLKLDGNNSNARQILSLDNVDLSIKDAVDCSVKASSGLSHELSPSYVGKEAEIDLTQMNGEKWCHMKSALHFVCFSTHTNAFVQLK